MNPKSILVILGGMTLSFTLILGLMLAIFAPSQPAAPTRPKSQRQRPLAQTRSPAKPKAQPLALQPTRKPTPIKSLSAAEPTPAPTRPITNKEMAAFKNDLKTQLNQLKANRDNMVADLAAQMERLATPKAAAHLADLDDDVALLVLTQLQPKRRQAILAPLDQSRAQRLRRSLKSNAAP